jgi:hypothetical protein
MHLCALEMSLGVTYLALAGSGCLAGLCLQKCLKFLESATLLLPSVLEKLLIILDIYSVSSALQRPPEQSALLVTACLRDSAVMTYRVEHTPALGRHIVTTARCRWGDVILEQEPYAAVLYTDAGKERCHHSFELTHGQQRCDEAFPLLFLRSAA